MKAVFCGGVPLAVEIMKQFEDLSGIKICEGYGLSETSNVLTVNPEIYKPGSVGIPWKERLAPYKVPKIVQFIDQLPRTPVGKPDRKALRLMNEEGG